MVRLGLATLLLSLLGWGLVERQRSQATIDKLDELSAQLARLANRPAAPPILLPAAPSTSPRSPLPPPLPALSPPPPPSEAEPVHDAARSPEHDEAVADAHHVLDTALARHRLSPDDVAAMHEALAVANDRSESRDVARRIAAAVTRGELVADDPRHLFP